MECEPTFPWPICEQPAVSTSLLSDAAEWPVKHCPHDGAYFRRLNSTYACYRLAGRGSSRGIEDWMTDARTDTLTLTVLTGSRQATTYCV